MKRLLFLVPFMALIMSAGAQQADYAAQARALVAKMTLEEKASLCSGRDFWSTRPIDRLGIPSIFMTDGPHGLRKGVDAGFTTSVPATCFPTASALASSWNPMLAWQEGKALGEECQANDVQIILGPGVNMKRSPLGGRNFEYFSEDPILAGHMGSALIQGEQSQGIGSSLKHFAGNNQETDRLTMSSEIDERTLNELYLPAFEMAVKEAHPLTVMCAYNKLNGTYCSQNPWLLTDMLRTNWGFTGLVVSDWGAVDDRVAGVKAGLDLEMPGGSDLNTQKIINAVNGGTLNVSTLDSVVASVVAVTLQLHATRKVGATFDAQAHHDLARKIDGECIVLLKNEQHILPLSGNKTIAIIGAFAKVPRYQGGGSSLINATQVSNAFDEISKIEGNKVHILYAPGYTPEGSTTDAMIAEARQVAGHADLVLLFTGLPESYESEGYDRKDINLPGSFNQLIDAVAGVQPNTAVILMNGSAVAMPWIGKVKGVVEGWLGGQASGGALADVVTGRVNPSGKLSETFPVKLEDTPPYPMFPARNGKAQYGEGVFTGYRYYDSKQIAPLFPFGFGLSYTSFAYTGISSNVAEMKDMDSVTVSVNVRNSGAIPGKEVVELYVHEQQGKVVQPEKELKHFSKIDLQPGEEKTVHFTLGYRDFAYFDASVHNWQVNTGNFDILVGGSSGDLPLKQTVHVTATSILYPILNRYSTLNEVVKNPRGQTVHDDLVNVMVVSLLGNPSATETAAAAAARKKTTAMLGSLLGDEPLCKLIDFSKGVFTEEKLQDILKTLNQ